MLCASILLFNVIARALSQKWPDGCGCRSDQRAVQYKIEANHRPPFQDDFSTKAAKQFPFRIPVNVNHG